MKLSVPDRATPVVTASIYCAGALDRLICEAIAPFWTRMAERAAARDCFLWFARYGRGGEHLKVRFHGPPESRQEVRQALSRAVRDFLASLPGEAAPADRDCKASQFPVDPEDECSSAYPDRTLLWTTHRWVPGIMGRHPMSDDSRHAALFTRCLGIASEINLRSFRPAPDGTIPPALRTSLALKFFVATYRALRLPAEARVEYLRYHRDWLLTSFELDVARLCEQFDERLRRRPEVLEGLRPLLDGEREGDSEGEGAVDGDLFASWQERAAELFDYVLERANDPGFLRDPYLKDQVFATPFKLVHALTNQLATGVMNEGYLCQLLLRACEDGWPDATQERRLG